MGQLMPTMLHQTGFLGIGQIDAGDGDFTERVHGDGPFMKKPTGLAVGLVVMPVSGDVVGLTQRRPRRALRVQLALRD